MPPFPFPPDETFRRPAEGFVAFGVQKARARILHPGPFSSQDCGYFFATPAFVIKSLYSTACSAMNF